MNRVHPFAHSSQQQFVLLQPGDKVVACSASFGDDIWPAEGFGQVMYALKTRNGDVYLKLEARCVSSLYTQSCDATMLHSCLPLTCCMIPHTISNFTRSVVATCGADSVRIRCVHLLELVK